MIYDAGIINCAIGRIMSRDSLVGIATGYGLDDQGEWDFESRYGKTFSLLRIVKTGFGVHPTSYNMGTGVSFPGVKRQGCEADHSPPTSAEVKKYGSIHPLPHTSSWRNA
jgi:hypothetical protein